jgi:hypothetical protein
MGAVWKATDGFGHLDTDQPLCSKNPLREPNRGLAPQLLAKAGGSYPPEQTSRLRTGISAASWLDCSGLSLHSGTKRQTMNTRDGPAPCAACIWHEGGTGHGERD